MSHENSLAYVDATDAQLMPAEASKSTLNERQTHDLNECEKHLQQLKPRINARQEELAYLWAEAAIYLLKAREIHHVDQRGTDGATGRFIAGGTKDCPGFRAWLARPEVNISKTTAYRWMQGAINCGLSAESTPADIAALKNANRLEGTTPQKFGRKPVTKHTIHLEPEPWTEELIYAERMRQLREFYGGWKEATLGQFVVAESWLELDSRERDDLCGILRDALERVEKFNADVKAAGIAPEGTKKRPANSGSEGVAPFESEPQQLPYFDRSQSKRQRWWYGYQTADGGIILHAFNGDMEPVLALQKAMPEIKVVGPIRGSDVRYVRRRIREATAGEKTEKTPTARVPMPLSR